MATKKSAVLRLMDLVYEAPLDGTSNSWVRVNMALRQTLSLAIGVGLKFSRGDFQYIFGHYNADYWISDHEWWYTQAVSVGNMSATLSYEDFSAREPFFAYDVDQPECGYAPRTGTRVQDRLTLGSQFMWKDVIVRVTSFAEDGSYLTALSTVGARRFMITREDLIADRAERKATAKSS